MLTLLFYFFLTLLSLVDHLQGKITQSAGFSFDLVHRYSPKSPLYNSSMTLQERNQRLVRQSALRHHRHMKRLKDKEFETDIIPNDGDYLIKIHVGSPPVDLFAVADTGSDLIWVQCQPCDSCYPQTTPLFEPTKSSTYHTIPCNSTYCTKNNPTMQCDNDETTNECEYFYAYGNGSTISVGIMGMDKFTFASNFAPSCVFGCGCVQDGEFDNDSSGLVGLGGGPLSLVSQLGPTIAHKFSYCLNPPTSNTTSRLRLGSKQPITGPKPNPKPSVTTPLITQDIPTYYAINLKGVRVGKQQEIMVNKSIVIDSGSTLTYIDASAYSRLEAMVKKAITAQPIAKPPEELRLCYDKKAKIKAEFNVVFEFDGGEILLEDRNIFIDYDELVCFAIVPTQEEGDSMILGNIAQVNFEVEFDLKAKTVSFTPTICKTREDHGALANHI